MTLRKLWLPDSGAPVSVAATASMPGSERISSLPDRSKRVVPSTVANRRPVTAVCIVTSPRVSKPGCTLRRVMKLRIINAEPTSSVNAIATSEITSAARSRV